MEFVALALLLIYFLMMIRPGLLNRRQMSVAGFFYFSFSAITLYLAFKKSIWLGTLAIPGLLIFMFIAQILAGMITRAIWKREAQGPGPEDRGPNDE